MFGNLTGTYPGIQAAFYEPELGKSDPTWAHRLPAQSSIPGCDSQRAENASIFNEVKRQIHSRKTRRGRITKLASVLGNPSQGGCRECINFNEVKTQIPLPVRVKEKARITRQATVHGKPSHAACSGTSQVPTPAFRPHFASPGEPQIPARAKSSPNNLLRQRGFRCQQAKMHEDD